MRVSVFEHGFSLVSENDYEEWWLRAQDTESVHKTGVGCNPWFVQFCFDKPTRRCDPQQESEPTAETLAEHEAFLCRIQQRNDDNLNRAFDDGFAAGATR